jgi:uncharacterized membrane protein
MLNIIHFPLLSMLGHEWITLLLVVTSLVGGLRLLSLPGVQGSDKIRPALCAVSGIRDKRRNNE